MAAASGDVPAIDSERLTLRGYRKEDFSEIAATWANPDVTKFIGGKPLTEEEVWSKFLRQVGHWSIMGFGYWVVREKGTDRYVGEVGFSDFKRDMEPSIAGIPEHGWVLNPWCHGKGFATEAVKATLAWAKEHLTKEPRRVCIIDDGNVASIGVAEKCGYREKVCTTYKGSPIILFEQ